MGIICPNHGVFTTFHGQILPIAVDGLLFLAGSLP